MQKKLTLSIDAEIYEALHKMAGQRKIGRFIENLVRPHITSLELPEAGTRLAQDGHRESEALPWVRTNGTDAGDEAR